MIKNIFIFFGIVFLVFILFIIVLLYLGMFSSSPGPSHDTYASIDIKNAYTAAQAYFSDFSEGTIDLSKIVSCGFIQSDDVNITVLSGGSSNLKITAFHTKGKKIYTVDSRGNISYQKRKR